MVAYIDAEAKKNAITIETPKHAEVSVTKICHLI